MKKGTLLHLAYPEISQIRFKPSNMPDSQNLIVIDSESVTTDTEQPVYVVSRMSWTDLQLIICAVKSLKGLGVQKIILQVPYFLGARSDRKFEFGGIHYLKDVMGPIINSLKLSEVQSIDPHSDVIEACIDNYRPMKEELSKFYKAFALEVGLHYSQHIIISPDAGAYKKIFDAARTMNFTGEILTCSKTRELSTGKILSTVVPTEDLKGKNCVIIDDICDGGRTFIEIAKVLKEKNCGKIILVVTHGIFSKGFEELGQYVDLIYCTNSYSDIDRSITLVKQTSVFSVEYKWNVSY